MSSVTIVYIFTAIVSIILALFLAHLAKLSSQASGIDKKTTSTEYGNSSLDASLKNTVIDEVKKVVNSMEECQEVSTKLINVFSKEFQKRLEVNSQELSKKYETIIEEKAKNEELAWEKYNKALGDKKKTEAVIHSIAQGLVVVDAGGKVVMMNPAAERLLGVSKKDKIGTAVLDNLKEEQLVSFVKDSPGKEDRELELVSPNDETKKTLRASSAVIENENGQTVGMVSVLSDITKQKELDRMKTNFVASVSHELRTPLVAIDKSITLILEKNAGDLTPTQEQFLSIAERNLKRLSLLVNDLLDLSKLEARKMELKCEPVFIDKVIKESIDGLRSWANTKSINIEMKMQNGLREAYIDQNRVIQILNNLIGNAIKFTTKDGKITVEAKMSQEKGKMEVSVFDTGIGISPADIPKVFDKFYQTGERVSTDMAGTGIGLSIAKEIAELHGGRIWVESEKGSGTKFTFTLPLRDNTIS